MKDIKFMRSKEAKEFLLRAEKQWGCGLKQLLKKYIFAKTEKDKIYIANREIEHIDLSKLNINTVGMYFAELKKDQLRLSVEGAQMIGASATKNVLEITTEQMKQWFKGDDIDIKEEGELNGFVILRSKKDFLGTGKIKENKILNFLPKTRRLKDIM